jgi:SAM-dependent methyltransferase
MHGFGSNSYGDAFADVYDEWYADVTDVDATVDYMLRTVGSTGSVLELGVGTGRLAVPMAAAGLRVVGIDSSQAMLDRLADRDPNGVVEAICGHMVDDIPDGPFEGCLVAYNTLFNLLDATLQQRCFSAVANRLVSGGAFVVEAIVPDPDAPAGGDVSVRMISVDRVVLSVSDHQPDDQRTTGQFVEFTEAGGVRLRPWAIRWATPAELDQMADGAGFAVESRVADMTGTPFDDHSAHHVTTYRLQR